MKFDVVKSTLKASGKLVLAHKRIAGAVVGVGVLGAGYLGIDTARGHEVYSGVVGDARVSYREGVGLFNNSNVMTVRKGNVSYKLIDSEDETPLDWESNKCPTFNDALETVVLSGRGKSYTFNADDVKNGTLIGTEANDVFGKSNSYYNRARTTIRDTLRREYSQGVADLNEGLVNEFSASDSSSK